MTLEGSYRLLTTTSGINFVFPPVTRENKEKRRRGEQKSGSGLLNKRNAAINIIQVASGGTRRSA